MLLQEILNRTVIDLIGKGINKAHIHIMDLDGYVEIKEFEKDDVIYSIQIYPSKENPPTRSSVLYKHVNKDQVWKRYVVKFDSPAMSLQKGSLPLPYQPRFKPKGVYSLFFNSNGKIKFSFKMINDITHFIEFCNEAYKQFKLALIEEEKLKAERAGSASILKDKVAMRKKQAEARSLVFDALKTAVASFEGRIESMHEGETINLTLRNDIKVRLQAEASGVVLSDLEFNQEFDPKAMVDFLQRLGQVKL
jgi:hypothetical protein